MTNPRTMIQEMFDAKIEGLQKDLKRAVKAGMPSSILYDEIEELEALRDEIKEIFEYYCKHKDNRVKELEESINNLMDDEQYWERKAKEQIKQLLNENKRLKEIREEQIETIIKQKRKIKELEGRGD